MAYSENHIPKLSHIMSIIKKISARTIQTDLASTKAASFADSEELTPGVTGVLPVTNGGTGNTTGNAASATKLETARTIELNGAVTGEATFDGSSDISLTANRRSAIVGSSTAGLWYKVASITTSEASETYAITFRVWSSYYTSGPHNGILSVRFKTNSSGAWASGDLFWDVVTTGIAQGYFRLYYTSSSVTPTVVELWARIALADDYLHFDVKSESTSKIGTLQSWELYTLPTGQSSAPADYAWVNSDFATLASSVALANYATEASSASFLTLTSIINGVAFNGGEITAPPFVAQSEEPENTSILWIDTGNSNIIKFYDGSGWTACTGAFG